jgi:UDP-N-acetylglucosamine 2-epimerase (non-hydrolysing)
MSIAQEDSVMILTRDVHASPDGRSATARGGVLHAIGSRSEAVRLAPVVTALQAAGIRQSLATLVGPTGDRLEALNPDGVPRTEVLTDAAPESDVQRTARALAAAERTLMGEPPAMLVLGGDADSSLAFALAACKLGIPIVRVGGGLRCGDISLSEEINRVLGDRLSDLIFTDSPMASDTLESEGIPRERIRFVGNPAIDLLRRCSGVAQRRAAWRHFGVPHGGYVLVTLHRGENVRHDERMARITDAVAVLARRHPIVLPLHPVTRVLMEPMGDIARLEAAGVHLAPPLGYLDFVSLEQSAGAILTDSGGVQDEASALGIPCYTMRRATERVVTLTHGTNVLLGDDPAEIAEVRIDTPAAPAAIPLWDGRAADRIADELGRRLTTEQTS